MGAWDRIDAELSRRGKNWQWLVKQIGWTIQRVQNWKTRGIPLRHYPALMEALKVSREWLEGEPELTEKSSASKGPQLPSRNYQDRREVDESDWAMLQDIGMLPKEDRDKLRAELREKAAKYRAYSEEVLTRLGLRGENDE